MILPREYHTAHTSTKQYNQYRDKNYNTTIDTESISNEINQAFLNLKDSTYFFRSFIKRKDLFGICWIEPNLGFFLHLNSKSSLFLFRYSNKITKKKKIDLIPCLELMFERNIRSHRVMKFSGLILNSQLINGKKERKPSLLSLLVSLLNSFAS